MTRDELWAQFRSAQAKGWVVAKAEFPEAVPEPFYPRPERIFKAMELVSPADVQYLILGQDPYFVSTRAGAPAATGIAFAIDESYTPIPKSLVRILKYVYGKGEGNPSLLDWVERKRVLLLNAALTVPKPHGTRTGRQCAGAHLSLWAPFTKAIALQVREFNPRATMIAWGCDARDLLCKALGEDWKLSNCSVDWSHHPVASSSGEKSFAQFWETPVGQRLHLRSR